MHRICIRVASGVGVRTHEWNVEISIVTAQEVGIPGLIADERSIVGLVEVVQPGPRVVQAVEGRL